MKHMETISSELSKSVSAVKAMSAQEGDCKPEWLTAPVPWSWWKAHLHNYPDSADINTKTSAAKLGHERLTIETLFHVCSEWLHFLEGSTNHSWNVLTMADVRQKSPSWEIASAFTVHGRYTAFLEQNVLLIQANSDSNGYRHHTVLFFFTSE